MAVGLYHKQPCPARALALALSLLACTPNPSSARVLWHESPSKIHGKGAFAARDFERGEFIGVVLVDGGASSGAEGTVAGVQIWLTTPLGDAINHQKVYNTLVSGPLGAQFELVASMPIKKGTELTGDYRQMQAAISAGHPNGVQLRDKNFRLKPYVDIETFTELVASVHTEL